MAEWRVVYAGLRERFPELDRTIVRAVAESYIDEDDAAAFLSSLGEDATLEATPCLAGVSRQGAMVEKVQPKGPREPLASGEAPNLDMVGASGNAENKRAAPCRVWDPYIEAAVTAAKSQEPGETLSVTDMLADSVAVNIGVSGKPILPCHAVSDLDTAKEQEPGVERFGNAGERVGKDCGGLNEASTEQDESPTLEMLVQESFQEKERLAAELAAYAQLQSGAATRELEVEVAKESAKVAGEAEKRKMVQSQEAVARLREENERRCGEVHGELAMLATETRELRQNLALLKEERGAVRQTLERLHKGLHARVASAEAAIGEAEAEGAERRAVAQAALDFVEARLEAAELERADLDRQEAEANKLHHFIVEKGASVDSMLAEVAMLREDLSNLELLAAGSGSVRPFRSSFLAVGQAGSALRRSSHSQGEAVLSGLGDAPQLPLAVLEPEAEAETHVKPATIESPLSGDDEEGLEGLPPLLSALCTSNGASVQSSRSSLPSLLSQSAQSAFQSANTSLRMSQAPAGSPSNLDSVAPEEANVVTKGRLDGESPRAFHMGLYGPSPMNLSSQYMGVFQQQVLPRVYCEEQHEDEGWAVLESDSSSSGS